jgi:AmmeMemoRadiSam system protein B
MNIRQPARAGQFYEGSRASCQLHAAKLIEAAEPPADLPSPLYGGIVPHAGWAFSGSLAALTLKALHKDAPLQRVVIFGAEHGPASLRHGEVFDAGVWRTPLGDVPIDEELAAALLASSDVLRSSPQAHELEHSIEVQVPLLQVLWPDVRIVPIAVPPTEAAIKVGMMVGATLREGFSPGVRVIGSTDLTHHGGHFPAPGGRGEQGVEWTRRNDRRMIDLMEAMAAEAVVPEATRRANACGAGAIAATLAACEALGAARGICLGYTNSYEVIRRIYPSERDDTTVGYASVVFA